MTKRVVQFFTAVLIGLIVALLLGKYITLKLNRNTSSDFSESYNDTPTPTVINEPTPDISRMEYQSESESTNGTPLPEGDTMLPKGMSKGDALLPPPRYLLDE